MNSVATGGIATNVVIRVEGSHTSEYSAGGIAKNSYIT